MLKYTFHGPYALLPMALFLFLFIGSGVYLTMQGVPYAFYKVSASVAILPALMLGILFGRHSLSDNINIFLEGVREKNIVTMCMIYLLAGAYTEVLKGIGGVEATVHFALQLIPHDATLPGVFYHWSLCITGNGNIHGNHCCSRPHCCWRC